MGWTPSDYPEPGIHWDLTEAEYRDAWGLYVNHRHYRLADLCGYEVGNKARYAAIWEQSHLPTLNQVSDYRIPFEGFQAKYDSLKEEHYLLVRLNGYNVGGKAFFAAIWERERSLPLVSVRHNIDYANLYQYVKAMRLEGYTLVDLCGFTGPDAKTLCAAVWEGWPGFEAYWDWIQPQFGTSYQGLFDGRDHVHYRAARNIGFTVRIGPSHEETPVYTSVWPYSDGRSWTARYGMDASSLKIEVSQKKASGFRLVSLGGFALGSGTNAVQRFCPIWEKREAGTVIPTLVAKFRKYHDVPGLSLALSKDEKLVYAGGFGWADKAHAMAVSTSSLFRIASVSKPITAVAIMKLCAEGRLAPQTLVFGGKGILEEMGTPADPKIEKIIVRNLLEHSAGGWRNDSNDPMFTNPHLDQRKLIEWVLANRPLDYLPGTKYLYSNFGYCILGRIIEKVTGKSYANYVKEKILAPCGIGDMAIAGNTNADRLPNEVIYYDQNGEDPYGMPVRRMDAHGGWLATPVDLIDFALRVDQLPKKTDLLPADWISYMTEPSGLYDDSTPPQPGNYANGWHVNGSTWWHNGTLPGTTSMLARTSDGFCWAAAMNTRYREPDDKEPKDKDTAVALENLMWEIHDQVDTY
ncbi:serine hydrolase [Streptomyces sp. NPDC008141]|uniref:serine hydrolase n=1 Tax=Streptomyces sp. NPDC008141 TaxID=3364815 RepID=UPI0036EBB07F